MIPATSSLIVPVCGAEAAAGGVSVVMVVLTVQLPVGRGRADAPRGAGGKKLGKERANIGEDVGTVRTLENGTSSRDPF